MEDTEWNDILRAHGILPALPVEPPSPPPPEQEEDEILDESDDEFYRKYRLLFILFQSSKVG